MNSETRCKKTGRFLKGNIPPNKGMKQSEYMSEDAIERTKATRFKKGQTPHNYKPIGHERVTKEGYIAVKVKEPNVFKLKQRVVWEQHFGKIPKGYNVQFKDDNRQNLDIDNLYIISRADQMKYQNSIQNYPEEIRDAILTVGQLKRIINTKNNKK